MFYLRVLLKYKKINVVQDSKHYLAILRQKSTASEKMSLVTQWQITLGTNSNYVLTSAMKYYYQSVLYYKQKTKEGTNFIQFKNHKQTTASNQQIVIYNYEQQSYIYFVNVKIVYLYIII